MLPAQTLYPAVPVFPCDLQSHIIFLNKRYSLYNPSSPAEWSQYRILHFTETLLSCYIFQQPKKSLGGKTDQYVTRKLSALYTPGSKDNIRLFSSSHKSLTYSIRCYISLPARDLEEGCMWPNQIDSFKRDAISKQVYLPHFLPNSLMLQYKGYATDM